jgi:hypothetical protein
MKEPKPKSKPRATLSGRKGERSGPARNVHEEDVPMVKGMLIRGDPQSDIASFFGTNGGRISEINTGQKHADIPVDMAILLPPPGPYMAARSAIKAKETLIAIRDLINATLQQIEVWEVGRREPFAG